MICYGFFSSEEPLQRVVRISRNGEIMVTGGTDGFIRVWQFPTMTRVHNIKAHTKEIDDLDISADGVTVSNKFGQSSFFQSLLLSFTLNNLPPYFILDSKYFKRWWLLPLELKKWEKDFNFILGLSLKF